jgi:hypothetical protein
MSVGVLSVILASCSNVPSPSSSPTAPPRESVSVAPSPTRGPAGSLTFRLTLTDVTISTENWVLYLQTEPPSLGQTLHVLCRGHGALIPGDRTPYCLGGGVFEQRFDGFSPGAILVYRFERFDNVIANGTHAADGSVIEVTYPTP